MTNNNDDGLIMKAYELAGPLALSMISDQMHEFRRDFKRWEAKGCDEDEVDTDDEELPKREERVPCYHVILSKSSEAAIIEAAGARQSLDHLLQAKPEWGNRAWIASDDDTQRLVMEEFGRMFKRIWWMNKLNPDDGLALDTACRRLELIPDGYTPDFVWAQLQRTNGREMAAVVIAMNQAAKPLWQEYCKRSQQQPAPPALDDASSPSDETQP